MEKTVAVLLATYRPNPEWLHLLLASLNAQTYPCIRLFVRDDASPEGTEEIEKALRQEITAFPYSFRKNSENRGSNKTFEALVTDASEDCPLIAFCDQDDIWLPEKIAASVDLWENSRLSPVLVCSDSRVIDGSGKELFPSVSASRKRHVFLRGDVSRELLVRNFVMGCTVLMSRERALSYLPFPEEAVHDHYLALRASLDGNIDYSEKPLMLYRIWGENQTAVMTGVRTKEDYFLRRIAVFDARARLFDSLCNTFGTAKPETAAHARKILAWSEARIAFSRREKGSFRRFFRLRRICPAYTYFELVALRSPRPIFSFLIALVRKGIL